MTEQPSRVNPANALTLLRLVLVPVFAWLLLSHPHDLWWRLGSTVVFGLAILTDAIDGRIARKYNLITDFGKLWDSIADKALTGMAFIGLSILGELPWWITVLVLAREWGITWMRVVMLKYGVMAANAGGKLKTVLQSVALLLFLPGLPLMPVWLQWIAWIAMAAAVLLTVVTAVPYIREAVELRRKGLAEQENQ
jgi:CDP-diacylglycerol--glycerol-3-phosphate 3-phosphatidyltransferase